jgi:hypothetical protein
MTKNGKKYDFLEQKIAPTAKNQIFQKKIETD